MDYNSYRKRYFVNPAPRTRYDFVGIRGTTLYFEEYASAIDYYRRVLGPPAYEEGTGTKGWRIGNTWLTLLHGQDGSPCNVEVQIVMRTPQEADRLHATFVAAGGKGEEPSDQLMYEPVRYCHVQDPFGTHILIISPLPGFAQDP